MPHTDVHKMLFLLATFCFTGCAGGDPVAKQACATDRWADASSPSCANSTVLFDIEVDDDDDDDGDEEVVARSSSRTKRPAECDLVVLQQ